jgi:hypothetical protein
MICTTRGKISSLLYCYCVCKGYGIDKLLSQVLLLRTIYRTGFVLKKTDFFCSEGYGIRISV